MRLGRCPLGQVTTKFRIAYNDAMGQKGTFVSSRLVEQVASKTRGVTAVDHDLLSGDVRCSVRRKKDGCAGEVARPSPMSQRDPAIEARDVLLAL